MPGLRSGVVGRRAPAPMREHGLGVEQKEASEASLPSMRLKTVNLEKLKKKKRDRRREISRFF